MENKYKVAAALSMLPALINSAVCFYGFFSFGNLQFRGYLIGTILGVILSVMWLVQVRKAFGTHAIKLLSITFSGFFIKFVVFLIFIAGVYNLINFSRIYFAISFFVALMISAVIELWFYAGLVNEKK